MTVGGEICGYWAIGRDRRDRPPQDDDDDGNDDGENRPSDEETRHDAPPYLAVSDTEEVEADESDAVRAVLPDVT